MVFHFFLSFFFCITYFFYIYVFDGPELQVREKSMAKTQIPYSLTDFYLLKKLTVGSNRKYLKEGEE